MDIVAAKLGNKMVNIC